jgi:hypothetical protein
MDPRVDLHDSEGRSIVPGARVRCGGEEGIVGRIEPAYGVLTIIVEAKAGKSERMVRASSVEVLTGPSVGASSGP